MLSTFKLRNFTSRIFFRCVNTLTKKSHGSSKNFIRANSYVSNIRNCAVIAHVDHGKTTLVDQLLSQSGIKLDSTRVMDSIGLEKERGITIMAKNTSVLFEDKRLNIVDTPGHADFGGEVERVLSMVDGVLLVVDATEGPMTQTKFVLTKALQHNLIPVVVINKVDRDTARLDGSVENELMELFFSLDANDEQINFPILYASAKQGWAVTDIDDIKKENKCLKPLYNAILDTIPVPKTEEGPLRMLVTNMEHDPYLGRLVSGKITSGTLQPGDKIKALTRENEISIPDAKVAKVFRRYGVKREEIDSAAAGDIITISGITANVTDTVCAPEVTEAIQSTPIDPPTLSLTFSVNDSPLQGKDGDKLTSNLLKDRLRKEIENNVTITLKLNGDKVDVRGRGELQLGILVEQMRREGFELSISAPNVLTRKNSETGVVEEPHEDLIIDVPTKYAGSLIENLQMRGAEMLDMVAFDESDSTRLTFTGSSRQLMGFRSEAKVSTSSEATVNSIFAGYKPVGSSTPSSKGDKSEKGRMYANAEGIATGYAIQSLEKSGEFFIAPGAPTYKGMLVGECNRAQDMEINVVKAKKVTNIRNIGSEEAIRTIPPRKMALEDCISYVAIHKGLKIEVTPKRICIRREFL